MPAMPPVKQKSPATISNALGSANMDAAAKTASKELAPTMNLTDVANWWKRNFAKAGHKRLARELMKHATP